MTSGDLWSQARVARQEAERLRRIAGGLEAETWGLRRAYRRVWPAFVPTTWQGPAADRAYEGLGDAQRDVQRAADLASMRATALRQQAAELDRRAGQLEARARDLEAAERAPHLGVVTPASGTGAAIGRALA